MKIVLIYAPAIVTCAWTVVLAVAGLGDIAAILAAVTLFAAVGLHIYACYHGRNGHGRHG